MFASSNHLHTLKTTCWDFRRNNLVSEIIWSAKPVEIKDLVQKQKYQQSNFLYEELMKNKLINWEHKVIVSILRNSSSSLPDTFHPLTGHILSSLPWHSSLPKQGQAMWGNPTATLGVTNLSEIPGNGSWSFSAQALRDAKAQAQQPVRRVGDNQL